jgi:hypothetical protein
LLQSFPCPKCGAQIPVGQHVCGICGQHFEYRCRHCGSGVGTASGFCTNCGGKLYHVAHHTVPLANKAEHIHHIKATRVEDTMRRPASQIGRYVIVVAIIFFLVGIIYAVGTSSQGNSSNWLGGYTFGGQSPPSSPPSSPPVTSGTDVQQNPKPVSDSPSYTVDQVLAAAKKLSPDCRLETRRTG